MSVLSTVQSPRQGVIVEPPEQVRLEIQECSRLVFTLTSEAMYEHEENTMHFRVSPSLYTTELGHVFKLNTGSCGIRCASPGN